ncbi:hypothetical protein IMCC26134_14275 [Verrucomicrobia bacterium IMCC26134]|nr:hypothetical protein IMCC26134_14275 [Verrucomicrobia bacterium IMCC26134]
MENWQTPVALLIVAVAAFALLLGAWKKRRRPGAGCGTGGESCGCTAVKESLRKQGERGATGRKA